MTETSLLPPIQENETQGLDSTVVLSSSKLSEMTGTYYRSRVFTAISGVNPLISLAQPILTFLARIHNSEDSFDPDRLADNLTHELKTFESRCLASRYENEIIIVARYLLCVAIRESLENAPWPQTKADINALIETYPEVQNKDYFFTILERINKMPEKHIELLELAYLCLSLGFKERYQHQQNGELNLNVILEHVYHCIRNNRGDLQPQLLLTPKVVPRPKKKSLMSFGMFTTTVIIFLGLCYAGLSYILQLNTAVLPQQVVSMSQSTISSPQNNLNNEDL